MADNTSVGTIGLEIDISGELKEQISNMANGIGEQIGSSIKGMTGNFDLSSLTNSISERLKAATDTALSGITESIDSTLGSISAKIDAVINTARDNMLNAVNVVKNATGQAIDQVSSAAKKIKIPVNFALPSNSPTPSQSTVVNTGSLRAPPIPKLNTGVNMEAIKVQIDNLTQSLDITNARIEQQQEKLAGLKASYESTFNEARKNKLQEQILQTEAKINSLTATSDKAGFKLADLDAQFEALNAAAENATAGISVVNERLSQTARSASEAGNSAKKTSSSIKEIGDESKSASGKASSSISMIGKLLDRMMIRMVLFATVIKALSTVATFTGNALMTNTQFATSLIQIKTNLEVAFMPIYQAVLPALNTLMSTLSTVTAYIAAFVNALFGKTYQASYGAAKNLNTSIASMKSMEDQSKKTSSAAAGIGTSAEKAAKQAKGALSGFDEINQLQLSKPTDTSGANTGSGSLPSMIAPSVDLSPTSKSMNAISSLVQGVKNVIGDIFKPFKIGWDKYGASIMNNVKQTVSSIVGIFKGIGQTIADVWGQRGQGIVNAFFILLKGASANIKDMAKFFKGVWDDGGQYLFDKLLNFGASIIELAGTIYSRFVMPFNKWFAENIGPVVEKVIGSIFKIIGDLFNMLTQLIDWLSGDGSGVLETIIIILGSLATAWGLVTLALNAGSIAVGIWNAISVIGTAITTAFGAAMAFLTSPVTLVILAIAALIAIGVLLYKNWDTVSAFLKKCWQGIKDTAVNVWNGIKAFFANLGNWIVDFFKKWGPLILTVIAPFIGIPLLIMQNWGKIKDFFKNLWDGILSGLKSFINLLIDGLNYMIRALDKIKVPEVNIPGIGTVGGWGFNISQIPKLAQGGVIDQPTLAMVGEAGKEAVMPLENNTGWIDNLANKINSKGGNNDEVIKLLQKIYDILKNLDLDIEVDGDTFGKVAIRTINKVQRQAGKTLLQV